MGADIGHIAACFLEIENFDAGFGWIENPLMMVTTCHLALMTTGTFTSINVEDLNHTKLSQSGIRTCPLLSGIIANI